jgi:hypothetical protein
MFPIHQPPFCEPEAKAVLSHALRNERNEDVRRWRQLSGMAWTISLGSPEISLNLRWGLTIFKLNQTQRETSTNVTNILKRYNKIHGRKT